MLRPYPLIIALALGAAPLALAGAPLVAGPRITVPNSAGKFDFLNVDPARHRLLASHEKDETADVFDLDSRTLVTRVKLGPAVDTIVDPKTGNYYVSVQDDKRIAVLDGATLKEIGSIATEGETDAILFEPKRRRLYVTHDNGMHLWAIDVDAAKVVAAIDIPGAPECMALDADGGRIFLNIKATSEIAVIDLAQNAVVAKWPLAPATAPHGLVFDSAANRIYSSGDNGTLVAVDAANGRVVGSAKIVEHVDQIAFDPSGALIYCAGPGEMSVVRATGGRLESLGNVKTAASAKNVAVDSKTHAVWTTYTDGTNSYAQSFTRP
jgi:DNA-binding beta-propeller fold protein YncE